MLPWISKRLRLPPIIESRSQAPVNSTTCRDLGTALDRVYRPQAGGGVVVGWALRNSGGVWPCVMKRYEGVGGCQMYGQKALRNTWMAPNKGNPKKNNKN